MGMVMIVRFVSDADLTRLRADPELIPEFAIDDEVASATGDLIDFDKAWHGLHFTLTGQADDCDHPLSLLRTDSEPLGDDLGYGPAAYLSPATMMTFNQALSSLSDDDLKRQFDPPAMKKAEVYLADVFADEDFAWDYLTQSLPALRQLAEKCVTTASGAIVIVT